MQYTIGLLNEKCIGMCARIACSADIQHSFTKRDVDKKCEVSGGRLCVDRP